MFKNSRIFFFLLPRGFDLPTLGAVSRRICPQDHGAPLRKKFLRGCNILKSEKKYLTVNINLDYTSFREKPHGQLHTQIIFVVEPEVIFAVLNIRLSHIQKLGRFATE